ncbi:protein kinase kinase kinase [Seminavis robusta]|uniref:Protein kinase kinase kinase n=1 Tax=Seminavis robusta TaxID=568900 RepID=A0A9N8EHH5_9STRA|nr:protein kinase kinase kinase [Seminavis robusta]|eukprot:Sro959_g224790.1 protein kinase kinase kinase (889) ;mRNA; f:25017-27683
MTSMASMASSLDSLSTHSLHQSSLHMLGIRRIPTNESSASRGSRRSRMSVGVGGGREKYSNHDFMGALTHLGSFVDEDTMPYIAERPLPSAFIEPNEIREGKCLGEGEFSKAYEIRGFRFSKSRERAKPLAGVMHYSNNATTTGTTTNTAATTNTGDGNTASNSSKHNSNNSYAIKRIYVKPPPDSSAINSTTFDYIATHFNIAAKILVRECLYLANLHHPFILAYRGFFLKDKAAFDNQQLDAFYLVTDRMGETLEQRMKKWKHNKLKLEKECPTERFILESVHMDLKVSYTTKLNMHKSHTSSKLRKQKQKDDSLAHSQHSLRSLGSSIGSATGIGSIGSSIGSATGSSSGSGNHSGNSANSNNNSKAKTKQQRKPERYPQDLVALQTNYALQIVHALEYLHDRGIVVRDLRPNTIGFKDYPNHHTIQLFDFGFCKEVPTNGALLPPETVRAPASSNGGGGGGLSTSLHRGPGSSMSGGSGGLSTSLHGGRRTSTLAGIEDDDEDNNNPEDPFMSSSSFKDNGLDGSSHSTAGPSSFRRRMMIRKTFSRDTSAAQKVMPRADAKHYRAPESYPFVRHTVRKARSASTTARTTPESVPETRRASTMTDVKYRYNKTVKSSADNSNNEASEPKHRYFGYNCKADIYSLSMIYFEMLAEGKPYSRSILQRDGHFHQIQSQGQRPSLAKYHFPRTIKIILEQAWHPNLDKRMSAAQMRQRMTAILQMLEWKGGPVVLGATPTNNNNNDNASSVSSASSSCGTITSSEENQQDPLDPVHYLPSRAEALLVGAYRQGGPPSGGWSSVWNPKCSRPKKLDSKAVMDAIQERRVVKNKNPKNEKGKRKNKQQPKKPVTFRDYLPSMKAGMVDRDYNNAQVNRLLGSKKKKKTKS